MGIAYLMGIKLMINFRQPALSHCVRDFWSRWHISLTSWLRDYVFFSLAGRLKNPLILARNLFVTMFLGGLWHGANWTFVLWGCYLGLVQGIESFIILHFRDKTPNPPRKPKQAPFVIFRILLVFNVVISLPLILFRSPNITVAWQYARQLFSFQSGALLGVWGAVLILLALCFDIPQYLTDDQAIFLKAPKVFHGLLYAGILILIILYGSHRAIPFIYFQF